MLMDEIIKLFIFIAVSVLIHVLYYLLGHLCAKFVSDVLTVG